MILVCLPWGLGLACPSPLGQEAVWLGDQVTLPARTAQRRPAPEVPTAAPRTPLRVVRWYCVVPLTWSCQRLLVDWLPRYVWSAGRARRCAFLWFACARSPPPGRARVTGPCVLCFLAVPPVTGTGPGLPAARRGHPPPGDHPLLNRVQAGALNGHSHDWHGAPHLHR